MDKKQKSRILVFNMEHQDKNPEKIKSHAIHEISRLLESEQEAREDGLEYLKSIIKTSKKLEEMINDPKFKLDHLDASRISWINHYSRNYTETMQKVDLIRRSKQDLRNVIELLKEEKI